MPAEQVAVVAAATTGAGQAQTTRAADCRKLGFPWVLRGRKKTTADFFG
jgi:hypothetical protein